MFGKKGLSPLIATVLLIAFTITVATFIAAFSQTFVREQTGEFEQRTEDLGRACQFSNIQITAATYSDEDDKISALAWNIGSESLTDFRIRVFTSEVDFSELTPDNAATVLDPGAVATFAVTPVTSTPTKIQIASLKCPREAVYTCTYSGGAFVC